MSRHLHSSHKLKPSLNNDQKMHPSLNSSQRMNPSLSSNQKMTPSQSSKTKTIPHLHSNHRMSPFLNNDNNTLLIHLHLNPVMTVHFQIMAQNSNCLQQKISIPYQRNRVTVYIQNLNKFNQFCIISLYRSQKEIHEPHSKKFSPKFSITSNILA